MQPRSFYAGIAVLLCGIAAVALMPSPREPVALLERLAPRIERAQSLTPESRQAILNLMERARNTTGDARHQERRDNALQRVTDAIEAKAEVLSVGQSAADR